ncbi:hypothetical protein CAPTEDRAFT_227370 [Capitella teleta]|uniref:ubiquitinyl hydrolase 1 n=1 Tax=Capitella teleta TaxID=283909 RepID=R7UHH9_CAPTE|nr:hypothetical protein CAPTEDRAFT_227370 [Capitella teleta]|eukprot:ELU03268.1 hypothetical protein CAPTEDRAFT_227370 [Capitella teleta]
METNALPSSICESDPEKSNAFKQHIKDSLLHSATNFPHFGHIASRTIQLPDLSGCPEELGQCVQKRLLDENMQEALEGPGVLNWCRNIRPLYALRTKGDGNCLLHAVSVAMWGMEDTSMLLRRLVYVALVEDEERGEIKKRWHKERGVLNDNVSGFMLSSGEWEQEWEIVVKAAESQSVNDAATRHRDLLYESLEEIHIFVLANILKRPIIVLAEPMFRGISGHSLAPNNLRGIYLPLLWKPNECSKSPIVLGFNSLHFAPLLSFETRDATDVLEDACPLVSPQLESLYVHFLLTHEESVIHRILQSYLHVQEVTHTRDDGISMILSAKLRYEAPPENFNLLRSYMQQAEELYARTLQEIDTTPPPPTTTTEKTAPSKLAQTKKLVDGKSSEKCFVCDKDEAKDRYNGKCSFCYSAFSELSLAPLSVISTMEATPTAPAQSIISHAAPSPSFIDEHSWRQSPLTNTLVGPQDPPLMFEGTSMVSQECEYVGCQNLASIKTYPFCHEHTSELVRRNKFQKQKSSSVSDECTSPLIEPGERRSLEDVVFQSMSRNVPCREKGCKLYGSPHWDHRCSHHRSSPATRKHSATWQRCRKTGCQGQGNAKYTGFCLPCYTAEEIPEESLSSSSEPIHWMKITSKNSLPSQNLTSQGPQCIAPQCREQGQNNLKGLCESCYEWLLEKPNLKECNPPAAASKECCTPKCTMYGTTQQLGYCSKCWLKYQAKCMPTNSLPDPDVSLCKGQKCDRYGDPNLDGFCSACYARQLQRKKRPQVNIIKASHQTFVAGTPPETTKEKEFKATMQGVESRAQKSKHKCKKPECENFGNPKSGGYCNGCYQERSRSWPRGRSHCDR